MADSARSTASHGEFIQPPGRGPATSHCRLGWLGSKIQVKPQHSGGCFNETNEIYGKVYTSFVKVHFEKNRQFHGFLCMFTKQNMGMFGIYWRLSIFVEVIHNIEAFSCFIKFCWNLFKTEEFTEKIALKT